ncbi:MAG: RNA polymerase sigma-70 factor (ECF subfamily) [Psychromonas sp.]
MEDKKQLKGIIEGCIENNRKSQEQLFKLFYGKMFAVCLRYHKDRDDAQEVLQQGFIKVFDKLEVFDYTGSFEGWMRKIFSNLSIDVIRKSKKNPVFKERDEDFIDEDSTMEFEKEEELNLLSFNASLAMEAIDALSPVYKTVFNLYVIEEYTHKEIAELLNISEGTSKSNLAKAKMNLRKILNEKIVNIEH